MNKPIQIKQGNQLVIELDIRNKTCILRPVGSIDEETNLKKIFVELDKQDPKLERIEFDLSRISHINSCGIREWLIFLEHAQNTYDTKFLFMNEVFISEANNTINMFGKPGTGIESFDAPYYCPTCDKRIVVKLDSGQVRKNGNDFIPPEQFCSKCRSPLTFDELTKEYFSFLRIRSG